MGVDVKTPPENNPAGRLWAVLAAAQSADQDAPALSAWASVLGVEPQRTGNLLRAVTTIAELAADVREQVAMLPEEADPHAVASHLHEVDAVVERLTRLPDGTMRASLAGLTSAGMLSLRLCASALGRYRPEPRLGRDQVRDLSSRVQALIDDLDRVNDLDDEVRRIVLGLLLKARSALDDYRLVGIRPVVAVADEAVGALMRQSGVEENLAKSRFGKGFITFVVALDLSLNVAANLDSVVEAPTPSPVVVQIVERCGQSLELPPGAWQGRPR